MGKRGAEAAAKSGSAKKRKATKEAARVAHLNEEVEAFTRFLSVTPEESRARSQLKRRVERHVCELWPEASVKQFGSHETGLEWFESDVDLRVRTASFATADASCRMLKALLAKRSWVRELEARPQARIPVVCFRDRETDVQVDVSFDDSFQSNDSADTNYLSRQREHFRDVVLVLKALFNHNRNLDKPFYGGLGSFRLAVLVDAFLQKSHHATPVEALDAFLRFCCADFNAREPVVVTSPDGRRSLTVTFGNINLHLLRDTCLNALFVLRDPHLDPRADRLPLVFAARAWDRLAANRRKKIHLAQAFCRTLPSAAVPPPPGLYDRAAAAEGEASSSSRDSSNS